MRKSMLIDTELCSGCRYCEVACSFRRTGMSSYEGAVIRVVRDDRMCEYVPLMCQNCGDAPCAEACPTGAIDRSGVDGRVALNGDLCTGCELCVAVCPFSVPGAFEIPKIVNNVATICDYCGGDPACVKFCVSGALKYAETGSSAGEPDTTLADKAVALLAQVRSRVPGM